LPQQKLTNATIHVQVVEAPLRQITVVGNRYYGSNNIMSKLPSLKTNELLNSFVLQREIDAANTSRDRQVYTVLGPGPDPGTSALTLKVKDQMPWHARLELDNDNTPGSPALRANANTQYDNLWDADHQVGLQYSFTPEFEKYQTADVNTPFDSPLIANYSAYYRMPLGEPRGVQEAVEANPGRFGYNEATHQFVTPAPSSTASLTFYGSRATTDSGIQLGSETPIVTNNPLISINSLTPGENTTVTEDVGSKLAVPVDLVSQWKLTLEGGFDFKHYQLSSFNTNEFIEVIVTTNSGGGTTNSQTVLAPQPERQAHVNYLPLNAGIDLEEPDKWGFSTLSLGANFNVLPVGSANGDFATAAYTPDARAEYLAAKANFNRDEKIYGDWRVNLRAAGQWSPRALLSTEQFALGGINSVRGYHEGEVYGDSGWNVSIEPRVPVYEVASLGVGQHPTPCLLRLSGFFDYGQAYLASPPTGSPGHFNLCGTGLATMLNIGQHLGAQVTFAVPLIDTAFTHAGGLHFNFSLSAQF